MSDINNSGDLNNLKPQRSFQRNVNSEATSNVPPAPEPKDNLKENGKILNNDPASFLGRSLIKGKYATQFTGKLYDNIKSDLDTLYQNQKVVFTSDKVFDKAFDKSNSYSHATNVQAAYVKEFKKS